MGWLLIRSHSMGFSTHMAHLSSLVYFESSARSCLSGYFPS